MSSNPRGTHSIGHLKVLYTRSGWSLTKPPYCEEVRHREGWEPAQATQQLSGAVQMGARWSVRPWSRGLFTAHRPGWGHTGAGQPCQEGAPPGTACSTGKSVCAPGANVRLPPSPALAGQGQARAPRPLPEHLTDLGLLSPACSRWLDGGPSRRKAPGLVQGGCRCAAGLAGGASQAEEVRTVPSPDCPP